MEVTPKITLTNLPLNQFETGRMLTIRFITPSDHAVHCEAEFICIDRGLVKVKILNVISPSWYSYQYDIPKKYPNYIGRFRAINCYVWGQSGDCNWARCHWFKDIKTPAV